jgi:hypothetical protein
VDQNDEESSSVKLWLDANGNGTVEEGELLTLAEAGVASLSVDYSQQDYVDENGNEHRQSGFFTREDGSAGQMTDVWLRSDPADSQFLDEIDVSDEIALLPRLRSYGSVPDLWQVMARDEGGALQTLLEEFAASDPQAAKNLVWDIVFAWTGVTGLDPGSRGPHIGDARKLYAMERLWGQDFLSLDCGNAYSSDPHAIDSANLKIEFASWEQKMQSYLLFSSHYGGLYVLASQAAQALEAGEAEAEAMSPLLEELEGLYSSGQGADRVKILDFLAALDAYDSRGQACLESLRMLYAEVDPIEEVDFVAFLSDAIYGRFIIGGGGNDGLTAGNVNTILFGQGGNDSINGGSGDDFLYGGEGNDSLSGNDGDDVLDGGSGNDSLAGWAGDDAYVFGTGYGHDTVDAYDTSPGKCDRIKLAGLAPEDVEFGMARRSTPVRSALRLPGQDKVHRGDPDRPAGGRRSSGAADPIGGVRGRHVDGLGRDPGLRAARTGRR